MNTRYNENTPKPCGFFFVTGDFILTKYFQEIRSVRESFFFFCDTPRTQVILFCVLTLVQSFTRFLSPLLYLSYPHFFLRLKTF